MKTMNIFNRCSIAAATALAAILAFGTVTDVAAEGYKQQSMQQSSPSSTQSQHSEQQVREVQQKLIDEGYDVGSADGRLGPKTSSALREFQQKEGIQPSGQLDEDTMEALGVASIEQEAPSPTLGSSDSESPS